MFLEPGYRLVAIPAIPAQSCGNSITIGTTVNTEHEALRDRSIEVLPLVVEGETPATAVHGTAIAALLVGDDGSRTPGLLPTPQRMLLNPASQAPC